MVKYNARIVALVVLVLFAASTFALAASPVSMVQKVRVGQTQERVRIVLDMDTVPPNTVILEQEPLRLVIEMPASLAKDVAARLALNDPFVNDVQLQEVEAGRTKVFVNLKLAVTYKVFSLKSPNRLVIDLFKTYEQKVDQDLAPGVKYTYWLRTGASGPVQAYILRIDPSAGFILKPVLSNGAINGLETLSAMSSRVKALAAANGNYFAPNGEIIGLLKMDGEIVSTPMLPRTAVGILPDGKLLIDQVNYQGVAVLPDGRSVSISGVNRERGENEVILYNGYYGATSGTNSFGIDYVISDGKVVAISPGNTTIPSGSQILSAHGNAVKVLSTLKVGDKVKITQTLGDQWDKTVHAIGAGPTLVKNGSVFLTTKTEEFGSDVAGGRAPRTALGVNKDGQIILAVVDGRTAASVGYTLLELAIFMQELGAVDAMNLDGGGSSEIVINDKVINKPSDGQERRIGDALAIVSPQLAN